MGWACLKIAYPMAPHGRVFIMSLMVQHCSAMKWAIFKRSHRCVCRKTGTILILDGKRQRSNPLGMGDTQAPCSNKSMWGRLKIKIAPLYIAVRLRMTDVLNVLALTLIT